MSNVDIQTVIDMYNKKICALYWTQSDSGGVNGLFAAKVTHHSNDSLQFPQEDIRHTH